MNDSRAPAKRFDSPSSDEAAHGLAALQALAPTGLRRIFEPWVSFPIFALALLAIIWSAAFHMVAVEYASATSATIELSRELADTYEAQVVRNLMSIDQTLKSVSYAFLMHGDKALAELQNRDMLPAAIVFQIAITNAHGDVMASNTSRTLRSVSNERFFWMQRDSHDDTLYIDRTSVDVDTSTPRIVFSRKLSDVRGQFAGIVTLAVDPGYFTSGYDLTRMGKHGLLALLGSDGMMRATEIGEDTSWGLSVDDAHHVKRSSETLDTLPWDAGVQRFSNIRRLHGFPLATIVGLSREEQLAHFRHDRMVYLSEAAAGSVLLLMLTAVLSLKTWELAQSRARSRQLQQTYFVASEASLDAFFVWDYQAHEPGHRIEDSMARQRTRPSDKTFVLREVSRCGIDMLGQSRAALLGAGLETVFFDVEDIEKHRVSCEFQRVFETGDIAEYEWQHTRPDGTRVWLHRQVVRVDNGVVAIVRDVTSRKRAEVRRSEQNRVLEMIATSTPLNQVLSALTRLIESQLTNCACALLLCEDDDLHVRIGAASGMPAEFDEIIRGSQIGPDADSSLLAIHTHQNVIIDDIASDRRYAQTLPEAWLKRRARCYSTPILSHEGRALGALTLFTRSAPDTHSPEFQLVAMAARVAGIAIERTQSEERIRHMATHDALTGLPNRALLADRLGQVLLQAQRDQRVVTVVFVDLDNFKLINDSLGHKAGDELLKTMASRMVARARSTDTVVRLGGDEFVLVLFDDAQPDVTASMAVQTMREAILEPVEIAGQRYQITCSIGLASYPADGADAETLLMNADAAMYRAKEMGRNNCQVYSAVINHRVHERLRRQEELREALARGEFSLVYQPQVDTRTGEIFGVEALLRWHHATEGTISPTEFIPLAEESGLIVPIGDWVLTTACAQNKYWQAIGLAPVTVSVNVSARQFLHKDWIDSVALALEATGLDPQYLELELTESLIMRDLESSIATMNQLQVMGVRLSIDDFGTGYSSLSALKHFPVSRLKIDKSFVRELPHDEDDKAIATAVISLAQRLNLSVIAEGVETQSQVDFLRENNCHEIQGYYFSKPVPAPAIEAMLAGQVGQAGIKFA